MSESMQGWLMILFWPFFTQSLNGYELLLILPVAAIGTPLALFMVYKDLRSPAASSVKNNRNLSSIFLAAGGILLVLEMSILFGMVDMGGENVLLTLLLIALGPLLVAAGFYLRSLAAPKYTPILLFVWGGLVTYFLSLRILVAQILQLF